MTLDRKIQHVAIAGNIGAGKTTLSAQLASHFGWEVMYEDTAINPYLWDFYHDMKRWSFNLQIYFLNNRYKQVIDIRNGSKTVVQDRTIYEDAHIFAPNLHEMGLMEKRDFENYFELFQTMSSQIQPPDLLIYLRASISTLVAHIESRGRDYEGNMSLDYLKRLNEKYEDWIQNYTHGDLLIVPIDDLDFIKNSEDLGTVIQSVQSKLYGLF
ncbi:MAG TPA: deoxynucleoside kinase [Saprospiraceae bacterium]|nr:deoxynucleoside kinase [Saprospiraceae bacterium]MCB9269284.1 deoxynucleoside kinase [Lewinellaceae bacterium]HPG06772.1 deoxynucleoside kinase [Saprospiraceae bacterium]HPQ98934.1 deoxynucleoside kinase [Saprospiraceae bacterium]HQU52529.1 deoxynucleoside kinase [Saprospiraceae bacterium]